MIWEWICLRVWRVLQLERRVREGWSWTSLYGGEGSEKERAWRVLTGEANATIFHL
jgi:hypothetical protein